MKTRFIVLLSIVLIVLGCAHGNGPPPEPLVGMWHRVESGDTIQSVANRYGAPASVIREINDLTETGTINGRAELFVPKKGGEPPGTGASPTGSVNTNAVSPGAQPAVATNAPAPSGKCSGDDCLMWPTDGKIASPFGDRSGGHHDGLDIAGKAGSEIKAAAKGKVLYSGDEIKGYGNLVIISHERGVITVYAHNDKNLVKDGDSVKRGQPIAKMGDSGNATSTHLHFEVRVNEQPQDPLDYLP